MKKVKVLALLLALVMVLGMFAGCGPKGNDRLVVCAGPNPDTIDPALNSAVDGATMIIHAFSGLMGWEKQADNTLKIAKDCAADYKISDDGLTYTFTLKDGLKWSNGDELKASDFEWSWKRAASTELAADYGYMFDVIKGYPDDLAVVADDAAKTVTVEIIAKTPYFLELTAFPAYMPVHKATVEANPDTWATKPETYVGNGPYKMVDWQLDSKIVFEKNDNFHNADKVVIPEIEFALSDDDNAILANFNNGTYKFIDSVPTDEMDNLKANKANEFYLTGQLGTYYYCWNINKDLSPKGKTLTQAEQAEVRQALSLLINRANIVKVANGGQQPANSFVPIGLTHPDGSEFVTKNGPDRDGKGYYDAFDNEGNKTKALEILSKYYTVVDGKVTDFPTVDLLKNAGTGHEALAVAMQSDFQAVGISVTMQTQEWGTFLNTKKDGDYMIARNGWLGDYNDPISFIDMWTTASGNNDVQFGKEAHKDVAIYGENKDQTWAETFDKLVAQIKVEDDQEVRFGLLHDAEDMLMETGCLIPLYYYTDVYMTSESLTDMFVSPLGFKYFMYAKLA